MSKISGNHVRDNSGQLEEDSPAIVEADVEHNEDDSNLDQKHVEAEAKLRLLPLDSLLGTQGSYQLSRPVYDDSKRLDDALEGEEGLAQARIQIEEDNSGSEEQAESEKESKQIGPQPPKEMSRIQLINLWIMMVFMGSQLTLPFALAVFLVRDIYKEGDHSEQKIAQLTGFLAAAQSAARSVTALPWGMASDVVGRKVVVLVGFLASMISLIAFGSSNTYAGAVLARFLPSLLVGTPVALKSMMGDSCDSIGQAKAMTIFSLGHGLGSVIGPVLGGVLSYPCDRFDMPGCSSEGIFRKRPFLLPCLVISSLGIVALSSTSFLMNETQPDVIAQPGGWLGNLFRIITFRRKTYSAIQSDEANDENVVGRKQDLEMGSVPVKGNISTISNEEGNPQGVKSQLSGTENPTVPFTWWKDPSVRISLIGSGVIALIYNFIDELSPIFISAPLESGGLKLKLEDFTWPLACSGLALAIFAMTMYHRLVKWIGPVLLCRAGLLAGIIPALLMPTASLFASSNKVIALVFIYAAMIFRGPAKICALNSSMIIVNRVAGKKTMGRVNGAAMTLQSGGRALGPLLSGSIWALSVSLHISLQQFLGFILVAVALVCIQLLYLRLHLPSES